MESHSRDSNDGQLSCRALADRWRAVAGRFAREGLIRPCIFGNRLAESVATTPLLVTGARVTTERAEITQSAEATVATAGRAIGDAGIVVHVVGSYIGQILAVSGGIRPAL